MAQRSFYFLVVWLLMFNGEIIGQESPHFGEKKNTKRDSIIQLAIRGINTEEGYFSPAVNSTYRFEGLNKYSLMTNSSCWGPDLSSIVSSINYVRELGWFCKKELQLDKITTIPFRFRLGSLNYVNWMEQKPNAIKF